LQPVDEPPVSFDAARVLTMKAGFPAASARALAGKLLLLINP
jgi:hypothetical protein